MDNYCAFIKHELVLMWCAVHQQLEADRKLAAQKLKKLDDNQVRLEATISKLTNDHNKEVKQLKKERDDGETKAKSS